MKRTLLAMAVAGWACTGGAGATVDLEGGWAFPGYNDVAIPGDTGTRLSLTDDLEADGAAAFRMRVGFALGGRHSLALMAAPLSVESSGVLPRDVDFNGEHFAAGTAADATFRFDSYRLVYRYLLHDSEDWSFSLGGAAKVRDAAIRLEGGGLESEKTNTGFVPLLSFNLTWKLSDRFALVADGEALAAPQGRAEDVLFAGRCAVAPNVAVYAGYRILEGGADNDEVYTFSMFHYAVAGLTLTF